MQILAVDIGASVQNILLFDSAQGSLRLTMPSLTALVARAIRAATRRGEDLYLTGVTMGRGPCAHAVRDHILAGHQVYATIDAARTFDDDLGIVREMGIAILGERERPSRTVRTEMRDFDLSMIERAFMAFGVPVNPDVIALAVFDHGSPPARVSSRESRSDYLSRSVRRQPDLSTFAYMRPDIPDDMSRMRAAAASTPPTIPLMVMDAAFAALLGGYQDPRVAQHSSPTLIHLGTMHTTALHLSQGHIAGLFEHHTDRLSSVKLDGLLASLVGGRLTHETIAQDGGHGALTLATAPAAIDLLSVTGPRCNLVCESGYRPYFAAPHGDGMAPGCWGLIRACATLCPEYAPQIDSALIQDAG